jgi:hypothetical protein
MCDVNDDYRSHNIQFWLDSLDLHIKNTTWNDPPTGSTAYYTSMPSTTANKFPNRTNVYFHGGGGNTGLCGVYHGNAVGNGTAGSPDIVDCFGGCLTRNNTTVSHELGHYLAMPHTFYGLEGTGNLTCGAQATSGEKYPRTGLGLSNCTTAGDKFCDTYPDYNSDRWNCDANGESCTVISVDGTSMKINGDNYMSYANDACANTFTQNQEDRMHSFMQSIRTSLINVPRVGDTISVLPVTQTPANNQSYCLVSDVIFNWTKSPNARAYNLIIARNSLFTAILEDIIVYDTTYISTKVLANTTYFWKVQPLNKVYFCSPFSSAIKFDTRCVGTTDIKGLNSAAIVPNPVSDANVQLSVTAETAMDLTVNILNVNGQTVRNLGKYRVTEGDNSFDMDTNSLPNGLYFVQMLSENGVKTTRMVIAR